MSMGKISQQIKKFIPRRIGYTLRRLKLWYGRMRYRGNNFYCPVCEHGYRFFFDGGFDLPVISEMEIVGAGKRPNAICPGCSSNDRDRLVLLALKNQKYNFLPADKLLHIAPEPSLATWLGNYQMKHHGQYIKSVKYHEGFYYGNDVHLIDLLQLPFKSDTFNLVICNHVLEHIPDDVAAMKEILRVLAKGGQAILQVPWSMKLDETFEDPNIKSIGDREKFFGQFDHVRLYGRDFPSRLRSVGFDIKVLSVNDLDLNKDTITSLGLNSKELIFVARKA